MRILIVSCTSSTTEPYFTQISSLILKTINTQNIISDTELIVIQRNASNLTDYLYELDTSHINPSAIHNFEAIDLFFIVGNRKVHPWNQSMWGINCLIRMCLRLKRCLMIVSGCGFESLVFQLSCGFIGNVSLINKGVENVENKKVEELIKPAKKTDLFLDEIEGILYAYNFETNEWYKKRDCGLQNHHKMEEVSRKSRYLVVRKRVANLSMTRNIEEECRVKTSHSLFKGVPTKFMVEYISKWRANPQNCNFKILAETALGPCVVEFENISAVHFKINSKYPHTLNILENFIYSKLQNLFLDNKIGKIQQFLNREEYDKPSLSVPFRRIDNLQCPLPKIEFMHRLKKQVTKQKTISRSKVLSHKSISNREESVDKKVKSDWWEEGTRVSVPSKKPLYYSQAYRDVRKQHDISYKNIKKIRQQFQNKSIHEQTNKISRFSYNARRAIEN